MPCLGLSVALRLALALLEGAAGEKLGAFVAKHTEAVCLGLGAFVVSPCLQRNLLLDGPFGLGG